MTGTRRIYNDPASCLFWHPWHQHPGWHCRICAIRAIDERKQAEKRYKELEIAHHSDYCDWETITYDPLTDLVDIYLDYLDELDHPYDWDDYY